MSDNKKYYYLKFKENFFEQDHIKYLESMENGYIYSLILIKLYLKAIKYDGQLRVNEFIPYEAGKVNILSKAIGHDNDHVMHAINAAKSLGLIEITDTGEMWMTDIQNFIGHGSTEAERKAIYRKKIKALPNKAKKAPKTTKKVGQCPDKRPPELEIDIETEKEIDIDLVEKIGVDIPSSLYASKDFLIAWGQWLSYKEESGNRVLPVSARTQLEDFAKVGPERAIEIIRHTIKNTYKGLVEPKNTNNVGGWANA